MSITWVIMKTNYAILCLLFSGVLFTLNSFAEDGHKKTDKRPFCKTVDEAATWLLANMSQETTDRVAHIPNEGLSHLHFSLGMWIRNNIPVWGNKALIQSVGQNVHPDDVGGKILDAYWLLARNKLPELERKRMVHFEQTLPKIKGVKPKGKTHEVVIEELNSQIKAAWPKDAAYPPYLLRADQETYIFHLETRRNERLSGC